MGRLRAGLGVAIAIVLVASGCGRTAPKANQPDGLLVARPRMEFSDGRTPKGGAAFLVRTNRMLALTSAHLARNLRKDATLAGLALADAHEPGRSLSITGLACEAGPTFDGLDYSSDVAVLIPSGGALELQVLELAQSDVAANASVKVVACPADGSASQVELQGIVMSSSPRLLHVKLSQPVDGRGFTGAPILVDGKVVGMVQTVSGDAILATPRGGLVAALARATAELPVGDWK